jgi:hypothetical protein
VERALSGDEIKEYQDRMKKAREGHAAAAKRATKLSGFIAAAKAKGSVRVSIRHFIVIYL